MPHAGSGNTSHHLQPVLDNMHQPCSLCPTSPMRSLSASVGCACSAPQDHHGARWRHEFQNTASFLSTVNERSCAYLVLFSCNSLRPLLILLWYHRCNFITLQGHHHGHRRKRGGKASRRSFVGSYQQRRTNVRPPTIVRPGNKKSDLHAFCSLHRVDVAIEVLGLKELWKFVNAPCRRSLKVVERQSIYIEAIEE